MAGKPLTEDEKGTIRAAHAKGASCGEIAAKIGRSASTVSRWCKAEGLTFDTSQTAAATVSHKDRAAALRAELEADLLEDVLALRKGMHTAIKASEARDAKDLASAASYLLNGSLKIKAADEDKSNKDRSGLDRFLDHLTGGVKP